MKKSTKYILIVAILIIGIAIGNTEQSSNNTQNDITQFENQITSPNNNLITETGDYPVVSNNFFLSLATFGEKIFNGIIGGIYKVFKSLFELLFGV